MKKLIGMALMVSLASFSSTAMANNQTKLNFIKKVYTDSIKCHNSEYGCDIDPVWMNANESLRRAITHARKHTPIDIEGDHPCHYNKGSHALLNWGQDIPGAGYKINQFNFTFLKNGNIRANYKGKTGYGSFRVDIALTCKGNECKISDIYNNGDSFKTYLNQCHLHQLF